MRTGDTRAGPEAEHSVQRICCHTMVTHSCHTLSHNALAGRRPESHTGHTGSSTQPHAYRWIRSTLLHGLLAYTHL
jgi:hypothetical protein